MVTPEIPFLTPATAPQPSGMPWPRAEWPRATHPRHDELARVVDEMFTREDLAVTNAVVVVQGGAVVAERYGGEQFYFDRPAAPITAESPLLSWSIAKSMLHFVVGTLVLDGRLDPARPAPVPEWPAGDPRAAIRVADMLAMRDGLRWIEEYEIGATSDVLEMLFGEGQLDMAAYCAAHPLAHEPDTVFNYSSGTSNVLSRVVADVVGYHDAYRAYLDERLFGPLGMTSATATLDASGVFVASSYVHATALDFARFGLLYLRGGEWDGRSLVSRAWADTAQTPRSVDPDSGDYYSWHWWVTGDEYGSYWASGYEGQLLYVVPALDAVVVRFGHSPEENYPARAAWTRRVLAVLAKGAASL